MTNTPKVTFSESLEIKAIKVGEAIEEMRPDLLLVSNDGTTADSEIGPRETESYGFLVKGTERRFLGRFWITRPPYFIGVLWLKNADRRTDHKKWILEVYGRDNVEPIKKMAEQLSKQFEIEIHIRLFSENHKF